MADYYRTNAIYEQLLISNLVPPFFFLSGNRWILVYGDKNSKPKLLVYAEGLPSNETSLPRDETQASSWEIVSNLAVTNNIKAINIRFDITSTEIEHVVIIGRDDQVLTITLEQLTDIFRKIEIPVENGITVKAINDNSSSAYHNWQRKALGKNIVVSDIDLVKLDQNNQISGIFELKRSYYSLENWTPYQVDYPNFRLIWELTRNQSIPFQIVYNYRQKAPFFDDPSKISIFDVDFSKAPPISKRTITRFENYFHT